MSDNLQIRSSLVAGLVVGESFLLTSPRWRSVPLRQWLPTTTASHVSPGTSGPSNLTSPHHLTHVPCGPFRFLSCHWLLIMSPNYNAPVRTIVYVTPDGVFFAEVRGEGSPVEQWCCLFPTIHHQGRRSVIPRSVDQADISGCWFRRGPRCEAEGKFPAIYHHPGPA